MDILPKEIQQLIFSFLNPDARHSARLTSKQWHSLISTTKYIIRITSESAFEEKMKQLAQMPEQLALKFPYNNLLPHEVIENSFTKLQNLVSLDFIGRDIHFRERQTYLDRLEYLKIFRPSPEDIKSLTRIRQLYISYDNLKESFEFSTTIEDLTFTSVISQNLDLDSTFKLSEDHSRLTKLYIEGTFTEQYSSLTKLTSLRDLRLQFNNFSGLEPPPIKLANLDLYSLDLNRVEISIEDMISLTNLTKLVLTQSIGAEDLNKLAQLTGLKVINIKYIQSNMGNWTVLTNLEELHLASAKETGCTLENLPAEKLTQLTFVIEKGGYDINKSIDHINRLSNLKMLDLHVKINFTSKSGLSFNLPNLEKLTLTVKCDSLDLRQVPNLKTLKLSLNQPLKRLDLPPNLEAIDLRTSMNSKKSLRAEISPNLASLTKLKEFSVYWPNGSIDIVHENISRMTQLDHLNLQVDKSTLDEELLQNLTNLTSLIIIEMDLKNNSGNGPFFSSMTKLNHLVLSKYGCNNECIRGLSKFSNLTHLTVPRPSEAIQIDSVLHLTYLQYLRLPILHEGWYYDLRDNLQEKLPFLEEYQ